jgi:hypothetical protein
MATVIRKITLKVDNGRGITSCDIEVTVRERILFSYNKTDSEVWFIEAPKWFKDMLGDENWKYVKRQIEANANAIEVGANGMVLNVKY